MRFGWACAGMALALAVSAQAGAAKDALLDHLTGRWVMTGTIAGGKTTHDIEAQWVLQDTYVRLTEVSREKDKAGKPQYEAEVLVGYDAAKKRYVCFWFDITGVAAPGNGGVAQRKADSLPFVFGSGADEFHNTFTWQPKVGTWTWAMDGMEKGKLTPFARVTLKRP